MNYSQTLEYLYAQLPMFHRIGAAAYKADLNNTIALCDLLNNPQKHFKSIHIAGTNGKGSVSHMLASIFQENGWKTGLYTSPHLKDYRERIKINGKMIAKAYVTDFISRYKKDFDSIKPSFFEMTVALAFQYFRDEKVDIAVIETGLGGRLDSTNIIQPLLSVITNISLDHTALLGDTIEKIAFEKAGIIKEAVPVIIGENSKAANRVFNETAAKCKTEIHYAEDDYLFEKPRISDAKPNKLIADVYKDKKLIFENLKCGLTASYQLKNIKTVFKTLELLKSLNVNITKASINKGFEKVVENTGLFGRWQLLSKKPLTICDTGHNEEGMKEVIKQIELTPHKNLHFVLGLVNDKNIDAILKILPKNARYYFCKANIPRGLDAKLLTDKAKTIGLMGNTYAAVKEALKKAKSNAANDDLVFIGGSTFVVAEII
jgi:dihydrofolate synthase/folylpolyglutamate synthase